MPKAKAAAKTALRLDGSLAQGHAALGYIHLVYDWDAAGAERELQRALQLNPSRPQPVELRSLFDHTRTER